MMPLSGLIQSSVHAARNFTVETEQRSDGPDVSKYYDTLQIVRG